MAEHVWGFALPLMSPQELEDFKEGRFLHWATYLKEGKELDQVIQKAVSQGVFLNPTLLYEWGSLSPNVKQREQEVYLLLSDPDLSYYPPVRGEVLLLHHRTIKAYSSRYDHLPMVSKLSPEDLEVIQDARRNVQRFVKSYVQAGGKIVAGTDAPGVATSGLGMHHEMELLVDAGLTPMQSIQSSTLWAAEIIGLQDKLGAIEPDKFADLVILRDNPLEDIRNTKTVDQVIRGGEIMDTNFHSDYRFPFHLYGPESKHLYNPLPVLADIHPPLSPQGSEVKLRVLGSGFVPSSVVKLGELTVPTRWVSATELEAVLAMSHTTRVGTFLITVESPLPGGGVTEPLEFYITYP